MITIVERRSRSSSWLAILTAGLMVCAFTGKSVAQPATCTSGQLYQLASQTAAASDTQFYAIPPTYVKPSTPLFTVTGVSLNGLAYNPLDSYLYAVTNNTPVFSLYRMTTSGVVASYPITGATGINSLRNSGTFDAHGRLFVADGANPPNQRLYVVTGVAGTAPVAKPITIGADPSPPADYTGVSQINVADVVYSHVESSAGTTVLYGTRNTESGMTHLYRIKVDLTASPVTAQVSRRTTTLPLVVSGSAYGSAYLDLSGNFLVSANDNAFYRVDRVTGAATELRTAQGSFTYNTDGTTCLTLPLIDVAKQARTPMAVVNGYTFDVPYAVTIGNTGTVTAPNVQLSDNLRNTFAAGSPTLSIVAGPSVAAGACTANPAFNGTSDFALLSGTDALAAGARCTVNFTVRVAYANAASVPTTAQQNTTHAGAASAANPGYTWPGGVLTPPTNLLTQDVSTNAAALPTSPNADTPVPTPVTLQAGGPITFEKAITGGASPLAGGVVSYAITLRNGGLMPVLYPVGSVADTLPANTTHAGGDDFSCVAAACGNASAVTVPASGSVTLTLRATVNAGVAPGTTITNTVTPPAGTSCAAAPAACSASTTVVPVPADMSVIISGLPSVIGPGGTVTGQIQCTAAAGMGAALGASCSATAQDSSGTPIPIMVSGCTPATPVASLAAGSSITCNVSYTAPGTQGGSDTASTGVTLTAVTGASNDSNATNNNAASPATLIDALDDAASNKPAGAKGQTFNVAGNDQTPAASVFNLGTGSSCVNPTVSATGLATFDVPASGNCTVVYRVCAPAPNEAACDTAVLTVTASTGPQARDDSTSLAAGGPTTVRVLNNDPGQAEAAPGTIELSNPPAGSALSTDGKTLTVPGQGVWSVNDAEGSVVFTPEAGFTGAPTPIGYSFANATGARSNAALITLSAAGVDVAAVPTLSQWALMLMALLLGGLGMRRER